MVSQKKEFNLKEIKTWGTLVYIYFALLAFATIVFAFAITGRFGMATAGLTNGESLDYEYNYYFKDIENIEAENHIYYFLYPEAKELLADTPEMLYFSYILTIIVFWIMAFFFYSLQLYIYKIIRGKKIKKEQFTLFCQQSKILLPIAAVFQLILDFLVGSMNVWDPITIWLVFLFVKSLFKCNFITLTKEIFE